MTRADAGGAAGDAADDQLSSLRPVFLDLRGAAAGGGGVRCRQVRNPELDLGGAGRALRRSEEHTSELQSLMRISYAVFCLKKKTKKLSKKENHINHTIITD